MKTESVIKLPVYVAVEADLPDLLPESAFVYDGDGRQLCRTIPTPQAHAIARALNTQPQLLEACKGTEHDLREIRNLVDGLDDDAKYLATIYGLIDGRINSVQTAIAAAEKEKV